MIRITQGEPIVLATSLTQDAVPVSLAGWTIRAAVRRNADARTTILDGVVNVASNVATVSFANTSLLEPGQYVVSLRFDQPSGIKRTLNYDLKVRDDDNW